MNFEFKLPDIGEGLVEGEIVKWFVKEGDMVKENQPLASVLTDKAEVEIPSPKTGKVLKLFGKPGQKVKVHAPLAVFEVSGNGQSSEASAPVASKPEAAPAKKSDKPASKPAVAVAAPASAAPAGGFVFNLPDIGEGLVEGELVKWSVKVGDKVTENQPLAAVLTDKAEVEIPSPKTGTIAVLHAKPGQKVKVHSPLVTFSGVAGGSAAPAKAVEAPVAVAAAPSALPARTVRATEVLATPMVRKLAKDMGVDIGLVAGTGPQGRVLENDVRAFKGGAAPAPAALSNAKVNATPAVKALALELGVDIARLTGTGPGGRVVEGDVRAASPKGERRHAAPAAKPATGPLVFTPPSSAATGVDKVPFVGIRRKIAEKMAQSKRTVADVTHVDECDMTAVLALREELKPEAAKRGVKLTFLPFVIRALTKALAEHPMFNSSLDEAAGEIVVKHEKNIGIAVAAPQGLVVPNIKGADGKDLFGLAADVSALAEKVRANKIEVAALQGGTFTITNIGPIGGLFANPIVNHPEVAILGLMKLQKRPMVRDGGIHVRDMMNLCLSFDHRVVDGADAANFMNTIIRGLENPRTLL